MSISLEQQDWLKSLLDLVLSEYDFETAQMLASQLPQEDRGNAAIDASLTRRGASSGLPTMYPMISESQEFPQIQFLSILRHQVEIVLDVAVALGRPIHGDYGRLAMIMLWWASLNEMEQMEHLASFWREIMSGQRGIEEFTSLIEEHFIPLGEFLKGRAVLKPDPLLALPINQGLHYFTIRMMGLMGYALHDDERLQRHEVERVLMDTQNDRIHCVEATIALAWSNGLLEAEERNLIKKQIDLLNLQKKQRRKLLNLMITPSTPKEFAGKFSSHETGMFVLRQLVIASLIDGTQDNRERKFLYQSSKAFGLNEEEFHAIQQEMQAFVDSNKGNIEQMKNNRRVRPTML